MPKPCDMLAHVRLRLTNINTYIKLRSSTKTPVRVPGVLLSCNHKFVNIDGCSKLAIQGLAVVSLKIKTDRHHVVTSLVYYLLSIYQAQDDIR